MGEVTGEVIFLTSLRLVVKYFYYLIRRFNGVSNVLIALPFREKIDKPG